MPRAASSAIDAAIAGGRAVTVHTATRSTVYLVHGGRRVAVLQQAGQLTDAGRRYEAATGRALPAPSIWRGPSFIVGRSTYADVVGLGRKRLSTMVDGREVLTSYGRRWYAEHPVERVIHVPIRVTAVRLQTGHVYRRDELTTPLTWQTNLHESDPRYGPALLELVRATLPPTWDQSNEFVEMREGVPPEEWTVSSRRVTVGEDGEVHSRIVDQPLRAPDGRQTFTPAPEHVVDTAYQSSENCVVHQLSAAMNIAPQRLELLFSDAAAELYGQHVDGYPFDDEPGDWYPSRGVTPRMVLWLCQRHRFSCHGFWQTSKVLEYVAPANTRRGAVCFSFSNEHIYLMQGDAVHSLSQKAIAGLSGAPLLLPVNDERRKAPCVDLAPWPSAPAPVPVGSWFVESHQQLLEIRAAFLRDGRVPRMSWSDLNRPKTLTYVASKAEVSSGDRKVFVRVVPPEREYLRRASTALGFDYELEGFPNWMLRAFRHCLRGKREVVPQQQKAAILARQRGRCLHCGAAFSEELQPEYDHETPVGHDMTAAPVIRAMCGACHAEKTADQAAHSRALVSMESHLSDELWEALVEGRPPLALVFEAEPTPAKKLCHVDRRQSRTNILKHSKYPWPVCLPCDRIEPYDRQGLGDFCYALRRRRAVDGNLHEEDLVRDVPLRGDGWYHRSVVEVCLDWKIVRLEDITHVVRASAHAPVERVSKAFHDAILPLPADKISVGQKEMNLQRQSGHVLVGLWGRRRWQQLRGTTSRCPQDELATSIGTTYRTSTGVDGWYDYISSTPLVSRHTNFLLHRKVIDEESALLARLLRSLTIKRLYQVNTDSLLYEGKLATSTDEIRSCATKEGRLRGKRKLPLRCDPAPAPSAPWRDVSEQEAYEHVLAGGSICIEGLAGCGKSFMLRELIRRLREQQKVVQTLATTHVAVANLEDPSAMTCARYTYWFGHGVRKPDVVVLDEVSLVDPYVWIHLASILHQAGCACIFAGDWSQLPPVNSTWLGLPVQSMRDSPFVRERCDWTRCVLTECKRSDGRLFAFYSAIARNPGPLEDWVRRARAEFPPIDGPSPVNLVQSHKRRMALIRELQDVFRPETGAILVNPERHNCKANAPQQLWLWPGQELICANRLQGYRNQWSYEVVHLTATEAHLRPVGGDAVHKLSPLSRVAELFRAPWARTYHSAQGLGFDRVRLWDTGATHFSASHLIVGMSRCRRSETLDFGSL